ncbi:MAG: Unsaturated fatty acid biosythesis repressor FabR, TetR family, partial [uncultured Nocardioidaceae bacterium]
AGATRRHAQRAQGGHPTGHPRRRARAQRGHRSRRAVTAIGRQGRRHRPDGVLPPLRLHRGARHRAGRRGVRLAPQDAARPEAGHGRAAGHRRLGRDPGPQRPRAPRPLHVHRPGTGRRTARGARGDPSGAGAVRAGAGDRRRPAAGDAAVDDRGPAGPRQPDRGCDGRDRGGDHDGAPRSARHRARGRAHGRAAAADGGHRCRQLAVLARRL